MSPALERLFSAPQYSLTAEEKGPLVLEELRKLTREHLLRCAPYAKALARVNGIRNADAVASMRAEDLPYLPTRLFKRFRLQSVPDGEVFKTITSSGTSSQQVSRILLDKETAHLQSKALVSILSSFLGPKRLPVILIDPPSVLGDRERFNARSAGHLGILMLAEDRFHALDEQMMLDRDGLKAFLAKHAGKDVLVFGFTFMVWEYFINALNVSGALPDMDRAVLLHGGGWKNLQNRAVSREAFKERALESAGIRRVHDFYGMAEQVGSIYVECEQGVFHAPNFSDVIIRDPRDWTRAPIGTPGVIQTMSVLPGSYPGHSLLTEDMGVVRGCDDCACGRMGTTFEVLGRVPTAEVRGCSDTYAEAAAGGRTA